MSKGRGLVILCCLLIVAGAACLIVGIVLLTKTQSECENATKLSTEEPEKCGYSEEATRNGLPELFQKVQDAFYDLHPQFISKKPGVKIEEIRQKYMPYNPSPEHLKKITDKSRELLKELEGKKLDKYKLKPRERKGLAQMSHYLKSTFGTPFAGNFYAGDFLLGPTMFCLEEICQAYKISIFNRFRLSTSDDVQLFLSKIQAFNHTFIQYKANLMYGVKAGMVRSIHACQVGSTSLLDSFHYKDRNPQELARIFYNGLKKDIYSGMSEKENQKWFEKTGKRVNESIYQYALEYVGKPLSELCIYLKTTYIEHCVSSNVSSGYATIPVSHVYVNQTKTSQKTYPFLYDGSPLNGSLAYKSHILPFYTTTDISPEEVHQLGHEMVAKLYSQVIKLARDYTKKDDNNTARDELKKELAKPSMYYAEAKDIPEIESNETAYGRCVDLPSAKKYCPVRWKTIQKWFDDVNKMMSSLDGETVDFFHFLGPMHTTPNCPVQPKPNFNKNMGVASYRPSWQQCSHSASYKIPFFLNRPGPKFSQLSVNSHEARPGHHTQVQGFIEHFSRDSCGGVISWIDGVTYYTAFSEGWGLYAENPLIGEDTDVYKDKPLDMYGMLRGQLWRALRLVVDSGLHAKKFTREEALKYFADYAWEESDVAQKEVTRYQSNPGQATTYTIGQLHLIKLRAHAKEQLGSKFNLKDFHYYLLKDGSVPLNYLTESIEDYIKCTKDSKANGCEYVLATDKEKESPTSFYDSSLENLETLEIVESYY